MGASLLALAKSIYYILIKGIHFLRGNPKGIHQRGLILLKHNCFQETLTNWKKKLEATRKEICAIHQEYWSCWDWRGKIQFTEQSKFQRQSLDTMGFVYNVLLKVGSELHTDFCQLQLCPVSTNSTSCHYLLQGYICSPVEHCRHSL